jgi:hypothetical protein
MHRRIEEKRVLWLSLCIKVVGNLNCLIFRNICVQVMEFIGFVNIKYIISYIFNKVNSPALRGYLLSHKLRG